MPVVQVGNGSDDIVTAQISLPAAVWERLTADLRFDCGLLLCIGDEEEAPLAIRIEMFLDLAVAEWEQSGADRSDDLNDDVPF